MGIFRNFPSGTVSVLQLKTETIVERQAAQLIDGPDRTGSMGVGKENFSVKPSEKEPAVIRAAPQIDVHMLEPEEQPEKQPASQQREQNTQKALSDTEEETHEAPSESEEEKPEAPSDPEEQAREAPSDDEKEAKDASGPTELEGPVAPALRKLTISGFSDQ